METSDWEQIKSALQMAIQHLPEVQQEAVNLYFYDEMPVKEIAKKLNCSTTMVNNNLSKAVVNLRRQSNPSYYKRAEEIMAELDNYFSL